MSPKHCFSSVAPTSATLPNAEHENTATDRESTIRTLEEWTTLAREMEDHAGVNSSRGDEIKDDAGASSSIEGENGGFRWGFRMDLQRVRWGREEGRGGGGQSKKRIHSREMRDLLRWHATFKLRAKGGGVDS
ncbi:hypothetical protein G7Y79_00033g068110 [Physcia stellaris]|nr:hypothetical protein G7Y79_00033g068110 [Physcia stellaris]